MEDSTLLLEKNGTKVLEDEFGRTYLSVCKHEGVVLLAKDVEHFILIQQYRKPIDSWVVELPGGGVETGESLDAAVKREFLEETGYLCGEVHYLGKLLPSPWRSNDITHVFYTEELGENVHQRLEIHETINVVKISVTECLKQIKENHINESELCYAILLAILKGFI